MVNLHKHRKCANCFRKFQPKTDKDTYIGRNSVPRMSGMNEIVHWKGNDRMNTHNEQAGRYFHINLPNALTDPL